MRGIYARFHDIKFYFDELFPWWIFPPARIRGMIQETRDIWYIDDGELTKELCEEVQETFDLQPEAIMDCCACDEAKYEVRSPLWWGKLWDEVTTVTRESMWRSNRNIVSNRIVFFSKWRWKRVLIHFQFTFSLHLQFTKKKYMENLFIYCICIIVNVPPFSIRSHFLILISISRELIFLS